MLQAYQYTSKATENTLINHNKYILSLDKWQEICNINLDKYYIDYEEESRTNRIKLNGFMKDEALKIHLEEKIKKNIVI